MMLLLLLLLRLLPLLLLLLMMIRVLIAFVMLMLPLQKIYKHKRPVYYKIMISTYFMLYVSFLYMTHEKEKESQV